MAKQTVNLGTSLNSGDGDPLRTAFDKINDNFDELYARDIGTDPSNLDVNLAPSVSGANDLGTIPQRWGTVFVKDFIDIGNGSTITVNADGEFVFNKPIISTVAVKNDIVGSIFADDSSIAFNAQTNTFFGKLVGDVTGSVVADDSTVLIDGVAGTINGSALTGPLTANLTINSPIVTGIPDFTGCTIVDIKNTAVDFTGSTITGTGFLSSAEIDTKISTATSSIVIPSGSTQSIDVVAADSTLLVDSANGTLNATTLTGALPAINGSALTNVTTTFANITSTPTTLAGYGITDALALTGLSVTTASAGTAALSYDNSTGAFTFTPPDLSSYLTTVPAQSFASLTGKPTTLAGYGITDAAGTGNTTFTGTIQFNETVKFEQGVTEAFGTYDSVGGVTVMDLDHGHLFYVTNATGDLTTNFTNLDMAAEYATNITVIINQGATPYEVTAVQIGGAAQTINWQGGSQPTGNANGIDAFSFTILNDGGTYVVLGQMVDFT